MDLTEKPNRIAYGKYLGWNTKRIAKATKMTMIDVQSDENQSVTFVPDGNILASFSDYYDDILFPVQILTWIGFFIMGWSITRIANALNVSKSTIKSAKEEIGEVLVTASEELMGRYK